MEYFRALLTNNDLVDTREFPIGVHEKLSYTSQLYVLKESYEIVEYEPQRYINIRRLNSIGVTVQQLSEYCEAVSRYVGMGEHFTIESLNKSGFAHPLYDLGFGDWFYASLLTEHRARFFYQRMGGIKVFRRGKELSMTSFVESIVEQRISIDIYELMIMLEDQYGFSIDRHKIVTMANDSTMHYDSITEKIYIDYDAYFEEI
jgi:hypothetical protein